MSDAELSAPTASSTRPHAKVKHATADAQRAHQRPPSDTTILRQ